MDTVIVMRIVMENFADADALRQIIDDAEQDGELDFSFDLSVEEIGA